MDKNTNSYQLYFVLEIIYTFYLIYSYDRNEQFSKAVIILCSVKLSPLFISFVVFHYCVIISL